MINLMKQLYTIDLFYPRCPCRADPQYSVPSPSAHFALTRLGISCRDHDDGRNRCCQGLIELN